MEAEAKAVVDRGARGCAALGTAPSWGLGPTPGMGPECWVLTEESACLRSDPLPLRGRETNLRQVTEFEHP